MLADPADAHRAYNQSSVGQSYFAPSTNGAAVSNSTFDHWNAYQNTTICTGSVPTGSPLVGGHCYSVISVSRNAAGTVTWPLAAPSTETTRALAVRVHRILCHLPSLTTAFECAMYGFPEPRPSSTHWALPRLPV